MDFNGQLETLKQHASDAQKNANAAAKESRQKMKARIDQARVNADLAAKEAKKSRDETSEKLHKQWAKIKADTQAKMQDIRKRIEQRDAELDAKRAEKEAEWAEADAEDAIDYATWAADNAQLAVLDALDARAHADELAATSGRR